MVKQAHKRSECDSGKKFPICCADNSLTPAGTSIGANVREAINAVSKPDFVNKSGTAQKEADETMYWLELLNETGDLTQN